MHIIERSQSERVIFCMIPTIWHSGKSKTMETIKRSVVAKGGVGREMNNQNTEIFRAMKILGIIFSSWI